MRIVPSSWLFLIFFILFIFVFGCTPKVYYPYKTAETRPLPGAKVLIEPIRSSRLLARRYGEAIQKLQGLLSERLAAAGFIILSEEETASTLETLYPEVEALFDSETGKMRPERLLQDRAAYLAALAERSVCDIVLTPWLLVRKVEYLGSVAHWDGVARDVPYDYAHIGARDYRVSGSGKHGLSILVKVSDVNGKNLR